MKDDWLLGYRRRWLLVGQTLFGVALLVGWLVIVDLDSVSEALGQAFWLYVLCAAAIAVLSTFARAMRWRMILAPIIRAPKVDVWLIGMASSLINFVIPIRSGEFARGLFLKQRHNLPISSSIPTIAVDRSLDLLAILVVGVLGTIGGMQVEGSARAALLFGAILFLVFACFVLIAVLSHQRAIRLVERVLPAFLGWKLQERTLGILEDVLRGFAIVRRRPADLLQLALISMAAILLDAGSFYLLFLAIGSVVSPLIVLTGYALFALTFLIPAAPGYVGSMEAFGSLVFVSLGISELLAASAVLLFHALNAAILGVLGGASMWALGIRPAAALQTFVRQPDATAAVPQSSVE